MAYNVGDLTTQVQTKLDDTGYSTTTIRQFINDTQREIFNNYTLQFMEVETLIVGTTGLSSIGTLPTDFQVAIDLRITSPASLVGKLQQIDYKEVDAISTPNSVNIPCYWYQFGSTLNAYPTPNAAYTFTLRYLKRPTELTSASDVPNIPEEFQELLVLGAFKRVLQAEDSYDQAAVIQINEFDPMVTRMVQRYSPRQQGGPLVMKINRTRVGGR